MAYDDPLLLRLDAVLTQFSVGFQNAELVASQLVPTITVANQTDQYNVYIRGNSWRSDWDSTRGPGGRANRIPPRTLSRDTYLATEHALMDVVSVEEQDAAAKGNVDRDPLVESTEELTNMILMEREQKVVNMVTDTTKYASGYSTTLSGTSQWSDYVNSVPISDLKTAREKIHSGIFLVPTTVIAGHQAAVKLEDHPTFIERIKYSERGVTTDEIIAQVAGIPVFTRASAGKLTSAAGVHTETVDYMWGKHVVLAYVPARPGRRTPAFMYEFNYPWSAGTMPTERWYDDDIKSDKVRVSRRYDIKFITLDALTGGKSIGGYVIKNAVA